MIENQIIASAEKENYLAQSDPKNEKIDILGVNINKISREYLMVKISEFLYSDEAHYIITANPEIVLEAQKDPGFRDIINKADLVVPDGFGLILASKILLLKSQLSERMHGIDLVYRIARIFEIPSEKNRIFFLGARGENAKLAAQKIKNIFPDIEIAGSFSGEAGEEGDRVALSIINQTRPDILFIAYGAPKQEKWIARNLKNLPTVRIAVGVGGAFDIISGKISRAPLWMRNAGLEWLWRLYKEPRRIGRIYNATVKFMWLVLTKRNKKDKI